MFPSFLREPKLPEERIENAPQATRARLRTTQLATLRHFSIELSVSGYETYVPLDGSL